MLMKCPHCTIAFHDNWQNQRLVRDGQYLNWECRTAHCPGCSGHIVEFGPVHGSKTLVFPSGANRGPVQKEVPKNIAEDYVEACNALPISPKASAALSRRCLQNILRENGYKAKDLAKEIDLLLNESNASKGIPSTLRVSIDGIRNFGNFSAHPITDITSLQIIDVEPHEAEWCLEILEEMFDHFYVKPEQAKARKAALDEKLRAAGKPASK